MTGIDGLVAAELLDRAPCGFVAFAADGTVTVVNRTLAARLGRTSDELLGRSVELMFAPATRLFYQTHLYPLVKLEGKADEVFMLLRTKSGDDVGMLCNAALHTDGDRTSIEFAFFEVKERRKYEDALLQAKREAEDTSRQLELQAMELELQHQQLQEQATELEVQSEALHEANNDLHITAQELHAQRARAEEAHRLAVNANSAKTEFLAVMSHELRTPLNAIGGYAQLLETGVYGPVSEAQLGALARIARSQRHLLGLINDILNLTRIESGHVEYSSADLQLADVVRELGEMIAPQVKAKGLAYSTAVDDASRVVRGDREKVVQVILNMLSNAVKFTPDGGEVMLSCGPAQDGGAVAIEVRDTGRGVPADKIEAIFEPFVQVNSKRSDSTEGTGLGLAISRNLARGMGGDLTATSELGVGSSFVLTLPVGESP